MNTFLIFFYVIAGIALAFNAYIIFKHSCVIKNTPILTNKQKRDFSFEFQIFAIMWVILCISNILSLIDLIKNM